MKKDTQNTDAKLVLKSSQDMDMPIAAAFAQATDFAYFERRAMRSGIEVHRHGEAEGLVGQAWTVRGELRGRMRLISVEVVEAEAPALLRLLSSTGQIDFHTECQFIEMGRRRTRLNVAIGLVPQTFAARLMVQSLRLARPRLKRRLDSSLHKVCRHAEKRAAGRT